MAKMDAKFYGEIRKAKDGSIVPEDEWIAFLVKDDAFARILPQYHLACLELGADAEQVAAVERMIERVRVWREINVDRLKVPDAAGERLLDQGTGDQTVMRFWYRNWRDEVGQRRVLPIRIEYGSTEWHPEPQWLLIARDVDRDGAERSFAMRDMIGDPKTAVDILNKAFDV